MPPTSDALRSQEERETVRRTTIRIRIAAGVVGVVLALFLFAYPTQSLLAQQRQVDNAQAHLDDLNRQNIELRIRAKRLATSAEIERQARENFNMVRPHEKAFTVIDRAKRREGSTSTTTSR